MAGGKSRRLGQDKRFLILGGKSCLQRVLDVYKVLFEEIVIVADEKDPFQSLGVRVVEDMIPGKARLGGLYTGLHHAGSDRVFAVGDTILALPVLAALKVHHRPVWLHLIGHPSLLDVLPGRSVVDSMGSIEGLYYRDLLAGHERMSAAVVSFYQQFALVVIWTADP